MIHPMGLRQVPPLNQRKLSLPLKLNQRKLSLPLKLSLLLPLPSKLLLPLPSKLPCSSFSKVSS